MVMVGGEITTSAWVDIEVVTCTQTWASMPTLVRY
ncbi:Uncharacterised protein [Vibrio cholerae]|nr:Uncharacterised protein [Vibrio cholerae]